MQPSLKQSLQIHLDEKLKEMKDLKAKIESMQILQNSLAEEIDAIRVLIRPAAPTEGSIEAAKSPNSVTCLDGLGFRDAVRILLKENPNGLTTGEIGEQLLARGYVYKAETPLSVRISNETRRMATQDMIEKHGKRHILTEKGRLMAQEADHVN